MALFTSIACRSLHDRSCCDFCQLQQDLQETRNPIRSVFRFEGKVNELRLVCTNKDLGKELRYCKG